MWCAVLNATTCDCVTLHRITSLYSTIHYSNNTLHCTALHYTTLYYTALHYTTLHCTTLHYTVLHCTVLHCTILHCTVLHCTAVHLCHLRRHYYDDDHFNQLRSANDGSRRVRADGRRGRKRGNRWGDRMSLNWLSFISICICLCWCDCMYNSAYWL